MDKETPRKKSIALALGSGSARGLSHIGVIKALQEAGIEISQVAGTSMGALVGAVFAAGRIKELEQAYRQFDWRKIAGLFDVVFPKSGLLDGRKVAEFVRSFIDAPDIRSLEIPFCAVATNLETAQEVIIDHGEVVDAVRASISVPGIFTPVRREGALLVDGGLINPVPVSAARARGADIVIAVDLNHDIADKRPVLPKKNREKETASPSRWQLFGGEYYEEIMERLNQSFRSIQSPAIEQFRARFNKEPLPGIFDILLSSVNVMETQITQTRLRMDPPEVLIQPPLGHIRFLEFDRADEIIQIGYDEARSALEKSGLAQGGI